jgi:hypothetical protein
LNCEHINAYISFLSFDLASTGDPWVPVNPMGMGLDTKLNPSWVMSFLMGGFVFVGVGLGWQNPVGLCPLPSHF